RGEGGGGGGEGGVGGGGGGGVGGARGRLEPRLEPGELGEIGAAPADLSRACQRAPRRDLATAAAERVHRLHAQGGEARRRDADHHLCVVLAGRAQHPPHHRPVVAG